QLVHDENIVRAAQRSNDSKNAHVTVVKEKGKLTDRKLMPKAEPRVLTAHEISLIRFNYPLDKESLDVYVDDEGNLNLVSVKIQGETKFTIDNLLILREEKDRLDKEYATQQLTSIDRISKDKDWSRRAIKKTFTNLSETAWDTAFTRDEELKKTIVSKKGNKYYHDIHGVTDWLVKTKGKYKQKEVDQIIKPTNKRSLPPIGSEAL
ncbi:MAG: hypothetical protein N0E54_01025, partial [Candidatus Thiodiazotropha taylori]|nr:hypothetical protein [Candidatus Thiodiazotropha endolucinida]MCW4227300.1 hypothetical protein [Candidatus Thiodiazotropha taylori]